jgi:hypothetical protein
MNGAFPNGSTLQISAPDGMATSAEISISQHLTKSIESSYHQWGYLKASGLQCADSESNFAALHMWLNNCITHHKECKTPFCGKVHEDQNSLAELPRRNIYTGSFDNTIPPRLERHWGRKGRYFTLSHGWSSNNRLSTTKSTLSNHQEPCLWKTCPQRSVMRYLLLAG